MAGHQLPDGGERRQRARDEAERQERVDRLVVQIGGNEPAREHALQLGPEDEEVADLRVVERLDPQAVACQHRPPLATVPEREAEHPAELPRKLGARVFVEVRDDLGVAAGQKRMAAAFQPGPDLAVVVELPVLHGPDPPVFVGDGLVAALDVDDAESAHPESDAVGQIRAAVVGPAVRHDVRHPVERLRGDHGTRFPAQLDDSADSAHGSSNASCAAETGRRPIGGTKRGGPSRMASFAWAASRRCAGPGDGRRGLAAPPRPSAACVTAPSAIPARSSSGVRTTAVLGRIAQSTCGEHRQELGPRRRGAALVHDHRFGREEDLVTEGAEALAEIDVLAVHEETLVEARELFERPPPHEDAGSRDPIRPAARRVGGLSRV